MVLFTLEPTSFNWTGFLRLTVLLEQVWLHARPKEKTSNCKCQISILLDSNVKVKNGVRLVYPTITYFVFFIQYPHLIFLITSHPLLQGLLAQHWVYTCYNGYFFCHGVCIAVTFLGFLKENVRPIALIILWYPRVSKSHTIFWRSTRNTLVSGN